MNHIKVVLMSFLLCLFSLLQVLGENYKLISVTTYKPSQRPTRPRKVGTSDIICVYNEDEGLLEIEFEIPQGEYELVIYDHCTEEYITYTLNSEYTNTIAIGPDVSGTITIHTEENNTYQGYINQ